MGSLLAWSTASAWALILIAVIGIVLVVLNIRRRAKKEELPWDKAEGGRHDQERQSLHSS